MADIPALVASMDTRLDQLAAQISTLEGARVAVQERTIITAPAATGAAGPATKPARRRALNTTKPPTEATRPRLRRAGATPERGGPSATVTKSKAKTETETETIEPRRRAAGAAIPGRRSGSSPSPDGLQRLLADARSGLSAGAIAQQAGASYSRVLAQLRELESAGTVRRTGSRRSTLWLLITDEERIAQRAAELERLVGARREDRTQRRGRARAS
jgi:hypothetical protein